MPRVKCVLPSFLLSNLTAASKITGIDYVVKLYLHQSAFGRYYLHESAESSQENDIMSI